MVWTLEFSLENHTKSTMWKFPLFFQAFIKLHYYHERFILLVDENNEEFREAVSSKDERNKREMHEFYNREENKTSRRLNMIWIRLSSFTEMFKRLAWKLLEIHRWKICAITVVLSALNQPSACYLFPALIWIMSLPFRQLDLFVYIVTLVWSSLMLLLTMVYQVWSVNLRNFYLANIVNHFSLKTSLDMTGNKWAWKFLNVFCRKFCFLIDFPMT